MDADMNKYDLEHVVADHSQMSREEWAEVYRSAWETYYTRAHMWTILRRAAGAGMGLKRLTAVLFLFSSFTVIEGLHPLQGGIFRLKYRTDRRSTMPVEPVWSFYPKYVGEIVSKHVSYLRRWLLVEGMRKRIVRDPAHRSYTDQALTDVTDDEGETFDMLTQTEAARSEVDRSRKMAEMSSRAKATAGA
jgi:hypothetical protein